MRKQGDLFRHLKECFLFSTSFVVGIALFGCDPKAENKGLDEKPPSVSTTSDVPVVESLQFITPPTLVDPLAGVVSTSTQAGKYPWVQLSSEDLKVIPDPKVEAALRLDLVRRAKNFIDIITYDQRADEIVGLPLLNALVEAANRGVKIRLLTSRIASVGKDPLGKTKHFFSTHPTKVPIEFHIIGGPQMAARGWNILDGIHQKLFIVDNQINLTSGRGQAFEYAKWLDTGFVFKGKLVEQAALSFEREWEALKKEKFLTEISKDTSYNNNYLLNTPYGLNSPLTVGARDKIISKLSMSAGELEQFLALSSWVDAPPVAPERSSEIYYGRLLHVELIEQMKALAAQQKVAPKDISFEKRAEILDDPIVGEVIDRLNQRGVSDFKFYGFAGDFSPKIQAALVSAKSKGVQVQMFTNGREAHEAVIPGKMPIGWWVSLPGLDNLLAGGGRVYAYYQKNADAPIYVHRKLVITGDTVFFGSHNLTLPSSGETDEVSFEIIGKTFAEQMNRLFDSEVKDTTVELNYTEIHKEKETSKVDPKLLEKLKLIY